LSGIRYSTNDTETGEPFTRGDTLQRHQPAQSSAETMRDSSPIPTPQASPREIRKSEASTASARPEPNDLEIGNSRPPHPVASVAAENALEGR